jgi:hypothetical protein
MLAAFSTVAGDLAANLEDLAARGLLDDALPVVEKLDNCATELAQLAGGLTIELLRRQIEPAGHGGAVNGGAVRLVRPGGGTSFTT